MKKQELKKKSMIWMWVLIIVVGLSVNQAQNVAAQTREVSTFTELIDSLSQADPGDYIVLEDGVYTISGTWAIQLATSDLTIKSKSGNRESVIIEGWGMHGNGHHGFYVTGNNVTIQDLTVQNVRNHCIQTGVNVDNLTVSNCILRDAGEQILKVPASSSADHSENGLVKGCLFEYSQGIGPRYYIGGIDVHRGKDWIIQDNVFRDIRSPGPSIAEHAIHFWNDSRGTLVERNLIITCDRGIGFGLGASTHNAGIIRNNMIYHDGTPGFNDVGIGLESSTDTQVYNNTIFFNHDYPNAIEYRFSATSGVAITNNLTNKAIRKRDNADATLESNITNADPDWFVDPVAGDLHLDFDVTEVLDQGNDITGLLDDIDQELRPQGLGIDIGADEWSDCIADQDSDEDVDGMDLALFITNYEPDCIELFSGLFGNFSK